MLPAFKLIGGGARIVTANRVVVRAYYTRAYQNRRIIQAWPHGPLVICTVRTQTQ